MKTLPYLRVSTDKQATREQAWAYQEDACHEEAERRNLTLLPPARDPARSAKTLDRPLLLKALQRIADGDADALIVKDLERLTREIGDCEQLLDWFSEVGASLIIVEFPPMDPLSPQGRQYVRTYMTWAQSERERTGTRTSRALRAKAMRGEITGRPKVPTDLAQRIRAMHMSGLGRSAICKQLNEERVPTARGGECWRPSALQTVLGYERPKRRRPHVELPKRTST